MLIVALFSAENKAIPAAFAVKEDSNLKNNFKIFTKAVCEEKDEHMLCRDELFVKCNDKENIVKKEVGDIVECNNIKLNLSEVNVKGDGIFKKDEFRLT